jgi:pimeloyl-ACP methyl ester carboxylesterase
MKMKINDIELYYELHGEGKPIIFSHGWLEDCSIWGPQVESFTKNYAVILYDHRGHGRSDKPKVGEGNYSVQVLANDLYALAQKLNLEKPVLVGFSLGGYAAILLALEHPEKISKLVLVGTTAKMALPTSAKFWLLGIGVFYSYETYLRMSCKYGRFYKPSKQIVDEELARALKVEKSIASECWKELTEKYDVRDKVSRIEVPTLIIVGEKDKINLKASQYLNREIKGSELRIVPSSGHTVMVEKTEEFNHVLEEFISR